MNKIISAIIATLLLSGCGTVSTQQQFDPQESKSKGELALENQGYTEIENLGSAWLGCSDKDDSILTSFHFKAKDDNRTVQGTICCGLIFKGCTVRF